MLVGVVKNNLFGCEDWSLLRKMTNVTLKKPLVGNTKFVLKHAVVLTAVSLAIIV